MIRRPQVGMVAERRYVVETPHVVEFAGGAMPAVLCTPALLQWLERTAREGLAPCLEPGENSVGVEIELKHLAPTRLGKAVTCLARVIQCDGSRVTFQIEARDEHQVIARGMLTRQVIQMERFARLARK